MLIWHVSLPEVLEHRFWNALQVNDTLELGRHDWHYAKA